MKRAVSGVALGVALFTTAAARRPRPQRPSQRERRLLAAVAVSAAVEEMIWRGPVLRLLRSTLGTAPALAASAAAFAAAHAPHAGRRALATHAALAATLGTVALWGGGLVPATGAHVTYDVLVLLEEPEA